MQGRHWIGIAIVLGLLAGLAAPLAVTRAAQGGAWQGEYFQNRDLQGPPAATRADQAIRFDWGLGGPFPNWGGDNWSARWTKVDQFEEGLYVFGVRSDDGARIWVDGRLIVDNWADGSHGWAIGEATMTAGEHTVVVEYYEAGSVAYAEATYYPFEGPGPFWRGEYFPNQDLTGTPDAVVYADVLTLDWGYSVPFPSYYADRFSARFTRTDLFSGQKYTFGARADDGVRVYIDGELIIDHWGGEQYLWHTIDKVMTPGEHTIVVEYFEHIHQARVQVGYYPEDPSKRPTTPTPTRTPTQAAGQQMGASGVGGTGSTGSGAVAPPPAATPVPTDTPTPTSTLAYIVGTPGTLIPQPPPGIDLAAAAFSDDADGKRFAWMGFPGLVVGEGGYGSQFRYAKNHVAKPTVEARWIFKPAQAGYYDVYVFIPVTTLDPTGSAQYVLHHGGRVSGPVIIDQATSAGRWVLLGNFYFGSTGGQYVYLSTVTGELTASREVLFDAVMFVLTP